MKYVRFREQDQVKYGVLRGDQIEVLDGSFLAPGSRPNGEVTALGKVSLLAPVLPGKVVCVGVNYAQHAREMNHALPEDPVLFLKPPSALLDPEAEIERPAMSRRVDYEGELVAVMGRKVREAAEEEALAAVFGYTCGNDVTARDLQQKDGQWTRAKSFDTFCPIGPWVVTDFDPKAAAIRTLLNGEVKQSSNTRHFLNPLPKLLSFISRVMTLNPGDIVMTGTPEGVGPMRSGDRVIVQIEGIGELRNRVK
ncbi:Fumarylacetoacetate (FAA) hydrolase family [Acididesulfobacillus acetoxydans]|uniref:Fumarylacetoacetate (FAA) hydrolase family n=1 Tax=Acididesulfobacillus acetoxydans TaxID=1561005 RepID=A0A8S0W7S2_9FIRM|nr:fumarylacetoacetate hydrolase family protein [Acididesulfobacillus acetoxydans]CAA7601069.1 Fumarylacetoacetate (FAA) hydrolase family [Acididesulfobacillus acetoxydans]CEJ06943.1 Fumarylacetoacetate hydrolase domain-containing protein 2 homolog [Acididesulfobacillus acetoxydans]